MKIIHKAFHDGSRSDSFSLIPIGDVHIGSVACDEELLKKNIKRIEEDPHCYWVGLGDYCEFINMKDPRFDVSMLADWIGREEMGDLARAQKEYFLELVRPIAHKCLGLVKGNHEAAVHKHTERDIYYELATAIEDMNTDSPVLRLDYYGWLLLSFYRNKTKNQRGTMTRINLHHGFVGGKLAGAKALNMQRWLWTHECDLVLFGHSHNTMVQKETVEKINRAYEAEYHDRIGAYCGTYLKTTAEGRTSSYSEIKGYFPTPVGNIEIKLTPHSRRKRSRIKVLI